MYRPLRSLREGHWFKLICGASFQHLPAVRSLTLAYALAGADCVDVAADPAVLAAARDALKAAAALSPIAQQQGYGVEGLPWLMVSLNDGEDPHFRKAEFDSTLCPADCPRPCERICPTEAIVWQQEFSGVLDSLCYGCGRCLTICPLHQISTRSYVITPAAIAPLVLTGVDAVEIHTQVGRFAEFSQLWQAILPFVHRLKLVAISCPDGEGLIDYLWSLYELIAPLPCVLIWQTDGRPMSGDIGDGATRAAVKLGQKVLAAGLPGYVQLAGGTNRSTVTKLESLGLLKQSRTLAPELSPTLHPSDQAIKRPMDYVAGIAYGSYARSLLAPIIEMLEQGIFVGDAGDTSGDLANLALANHSLDTIPSTFLHIEENPDLLWHAVAAAHTLVSQLKPVVQSTPSEFQLARSFPCSEV